MPTAETAMSSLSSKKFSLEAQYRSVDTVCMDAKRLQVLIGLIVGTVSGNEMYRASGYRHEEPQIFIEEESKSDFYMKYYLGNSVFTHTCIYLNKYFLCCSRKLL